MLLLVAEMPTSMTSLFQPRAQYISPRRYVKELGSWQSELSSHCPSHLRAAVFQMLVLRFAHANRIMDEASLIGSTVALVSLKALRACSIPSSAGVRHVVICPHTMRWPTNAERRAGPACLNRISAPIIGASAGVRPPCGLAAG